ncbi:hypothetical protein [Halobacillus seohaensis]|uniref:Uncharacterized protein n=1 Tax=Halobacillus seohaensis TaxID=447421 RepID=A0ABW2ELQ1_9BACI
MKEEQYQLADLSETEREQIEVLEKEFGKVLIAWENEQTPHKTN